MARREVSMIHLDRLRFARFAKYASLISSVQSRQRGDAYIWSITQVLGSRLAWIESDIPLSCGPIICLYIRRGTDNLILHPTPEQRFASKPVSWKEC